MPNMSYCRFENTYRALVDCYDNLHSNLSESENRYREHLVELCKSIVEDFNPDVVGMDEEDEDDYE